MLVGSMGDSFPFRKERLCARSVVEVHEPDLLATRTIGEQVGRLLLVAAVDGHRDAAEQRGDGPFRGCPRGIRRRTRSRSTRSS